LKRNIALSIFAVFLISGFLIDNAFAFRCGNGLVNTGDIKSKVRMTGVNPTSKETRCKNKLTATTKFGKIKCDEKVEVWYDNCGDIDFVYTLSFDSNFLTAEDTEGRGREKSDGKEK